MNRTAELTIGDLVRPRPGVLAIPDDALGLIRDRRGRRVQVWFPDQHMAPWLPVNQLRQLVPTGDLRQHPWAVVSWLVKECRAHFFEWNPGEDFTLSLECDRVDRALMREIEAFLGSCVRAWRVRPGSMSRLWIDWNLDLPTMLHHETPGT